MQKFLLFLFLFITCLVGKAQTVVHQEWKLENYQNQGSFYWGVSRTQYPDFQGKYYYYVYFYSNSFLTSRYGGRSYSKASTYVRGISIYMEEFKNMNGYLVKYNVVPVSLPYLTCDWNHAPDQYAAWFVSYSPFNRFSISYERSAAYDYSLY